MRNLYIIITFTLLVRTELVVAQKERNNWFFSKNAALNFNTSPPSPLSNGALNTADNSASISDANGNILFYSDGITVYSRNHVAMPNGQNLMGSTSGGQSVIIVPIPRDPNRYILFSVPDVGNKPLRYSIVNMGLNNGFGDVQQKNILLYSNTTEKIAAVYNCELESYWVITHKYNSDEFVIHQIDKNGVNPTIIIQKIGKIHTGGSPVDVNNSAGQMSISKDGSKLALGLFITGDLEIFDFDVKNAVLSNYRNVGGMDLIWGVEFSEDASKLYTTQWTRRTITQFDLTNPNVSSIAASKTTVGNASGIGGIYYAGYLQRAPDSKIYIAQWDSRFLSTIDKPNLKGNQCQFKLDAINISPGTSQAGLCRVVFPEKQINLNVLSQKDTSLCLGESITLSSNYVNTKWSTGETGKSIKINTGGIYWAEVNDACNIHRDSVKISIINCSNCTVLCDTFDWPTWTQKTSREQRGNLKNGSFNLILDPNTGLQHPLFNNIQLSNSQYNPRTIPQVPTPWMPGSTTKLVHKIILDNIIVDKDLMLFLGEFPNERKYSGPQTGKLRIFNRSNQILKVDSLCILFRDRRGLFSPTIISYLGNEMWFNVNDASTADGEVFILKNLPANSYTIEVEHFNDKSSRDDGIYINLAYPLCCNNDTLRIDTIVCDFIIFNGRRIEQSGIYQQQDKIGSCISTTILTAIVNKSKPFKLANDTSFCTRHNLILSAPSGFKNYNWNSGNRTQDLNINSFGTYWCCADNDCGITVCDSVIIKQESSFSVNVTRDTTVTQGSFIQLDSKIIGGKPGANYKYKWTPKAGLSCADCPNPIAVIRNTTKYRLRIIDLNSGCESMSCVNVRSTCCSSK